MQDDRLIVAFDDSGAVERFGLEKGAGRSKHLQVDWGDGVIEAAESGPALRRVKSGLLDRFRLARPDEFRAVAEREPESVLAAIVFEQGGKAVDAKFLITQVRELDLNLDEGAWKRARETLRDFAGIEITGSTAVKFRWGASWREAPHPLATQAPSVDDLVPISSSPAGAITVPGEIEESAPAPPAGKHQRDAPADASGDAEAGEEALPEGVANEEAQATARSPRPESLGALVARAREAPASFEVESSAVTMLAARDARANDLPLWLELADVAAASWREGSQTALYERIGRILENDRVDLAPHRNVLRRVLAGFAPLTDPRWVALAVPLSARGDGVIDEAASWSAWSDESLASDAAAKWMSDRRRRDAATSYLTSVLKDRAATAEAARLLRLPEVLRRSVDAQTFADVFRSAARAEESVAAWLRVLDRSSQMEELESRSATLTDEAMRAKVATEQATARAEELQRLVDELRDQLNGAASQRVEVADRERLRVQRRALRGIAQQLALLDEELGISDPDALRAHARSLAERLGVRAFADLNESVDFDPLKHESPEPVSNGDLVTVVRPGYTSSSDEDAVLIKALVAVTRDEEWRNRS